MPAENTYSVEAVRALDIHRTPIQKQPEMLLCLVGISRRYYLGDEVYPTFLYDDDRGGEVPLDFANEAGASDQRAAAPEVPPPEDVPAVSTPEAGQAEEVAATDPSTATESHKRGRDGADVNAPPKQETQSLGMPLSLSRSGLRRVYTGLSEVWPMAACLTPRRHAKTLWTMSLLQAIFLSYATCITMIFEAIQCKPSPAGGDGVTSVPEVRTRGKDAEEVATLQEQFSGEEKLNATFEEFKRYKDSWVEQRCAEMDAYLDALSIEFDEELYPHMVTAIVGHRWVIGRGLRLAVMKCGESVELRQAFADVVSAGIAKGMSEVLRHGVEHGQDQLSLESIEAYDPEAEAKYVAALQALKDLKYPLVDQLEGLKDAPIDAVMDALYLESDTGDDASQHIRDLHPSSS
uniref:Transposase (Putative), gypsy type n=1 Tax=Tanacetum cinerariifolium TaxID=118510 RepID=A0A699GUT5_TANCI|nr:hypothetical protein [Tanacetum cinerariifolium]